MRDTRIHGGEEIGDIAVPHHHALGQAGRTRRIDQIGQILAGAFADGFGRRAEIKRVEMQGLRATVGQVRCQCCMGDNDRGLTVGDIMRDAITRISRIKRDIGRACLQNTKRCHHQIH